MSTYLPLVELTRGALVESCHRGALAVADSTGRLVAAYGDPQAVVFLRSSAKPFQALPLVEGGAMPALGLTPAELALICASHLGLDLHLTAVAALQQKIGVSESDLLCGTHPVEDAATARQLARAGQTPTPNRHNCSGKHTGMLALARHRGLPLADYVNLAHPVQQAILTAFAEICDLPPGTVQVGVDGCSVPNFAVPLASAATAFARLADPASLAPPRAAALGTIFSAMTAHPEMVRGPGSWDTEIMRARPGVLLAKSGAEGYLGMSLRLGMRSLGVALKIADGAGRAVAPAAVALLQQLGALDEIHLGALAQAGFSARQPLKNWRGLSTGEIRACFEI